jgi:3-hydroxyisobutyrate dehydrogenase/2-hydroxy-3-oxopropionate reductase
MAANVARAKFPLEIYNRADQSRIAAEELSRSTGIPLAESPAELASRSDVLISMVTDAAAVEELYAGPEGILEKLRPGTICIDMSTVGPAAVLRLWEKLEPTGAKLLDAPVSGSVSLAEAGQLTTMIGGPAGEVERVRPVLNSMASRIFHVGPLGSGATMKLAVNSVIFALNQAICEALALAQRAGVERETAYEVFGNSAIAAPYVGYKREAFLKPGETPVQFRLELARKDMSLVCALGREVGAVMPQAETDLRAIESAIAAGMGNEDVSMLAEYLRKGAPSANREG